MFTSVLCPPSSVGRLSPAPLQGPAVLAELGYLSPPSEKPYHYMYEPSDGRPRENCAFELRTMRIADARCRSKAPSLDREGFELWDAPTGVRDFRDDEEVLRRYHPEALALACAASGAQRGRVFDHQVRRREAGRPGLGFGRHGDGSQPGAVGRVHNDYSEESGRRRLALVLGDAREAASIARFAIVNVWRSIAAAPVLDTPLAMCDARTVDAQEAFAAEIRYPDRTGEIYLYTPSPRHAWHYWPAMERHEALVFKQYDSQRDGVARFTPHGAFDHPDTPADAPLRQSIEVRCLVVYD